MIKYFYGDLFDSSADAFCQGCLTKSKMNAGIAYQFKQKFPQMYKDYKQKCNKDFFLPGEGYIFRNDEKPHVINLFTQHYGPAKKIYVDSAFAWLNNNHENIKTVAMPKIATGLGKLEWLTVKELLEKHFKSSELSIEVWTLKQR